MPLLKGLLARIRKGQVVGTLDFQFNPTQVTRTGGSEWQWGMGPGSVLPVATFAKTAEFGISLELLFDARETYDVQLQGLRGVLSEAESLALPAVDRWHNTRSALAVAPDRLRLVLGPRVWSCELMNFNIVEELFNEKLEPIRARVTYQLRMTNVGLSSLQAYIDQIDAYRNLYMGRNASRSPNASGDPFSGLGNKY